MRLELGVPLITLLFAGCKGGEACVDCETNETDTDTDTDADTDTDTDADADNDSIATATPIELADYDDPAFEDGIESAGDRDFYAVVPAERLIALTHDPEVKAELIANTEASVERGTFGAPTFYVDDQIFFGKDSLGDVEAEIMRRAGTQP